MLKMHNTDNENNGSQNENHDAPEAIVIINCALNAVLMLLAIPGNALVLAAIMRTPSIRSPSMTMLCSLAISDLLVGFIVQPFYIAHQLTKESHLHILEGAIGHSVCGVSFLTITAITVDRFLALNHHMRYASLVTTSRVRRTLIMLWLTSFALLGIFFWNMRVYRFLISLIIAICFLISTFCYIRIYQILRYHQSEIQAQRQALQSSTAGINKDIKGLSVVNTFVFYIALISCYFPMYVFLTLNGLSYKDWQPEWNFSATLVFSNSAINPFLYCWRLRELRTAVVQTARQVLWKKT